MFDALLAGVTPMEAPGDLYAVVTDGGPSAATVAALTQLVGPERALLVGAGGGVAGSAERLVEPRDRGTLPSVLTGLLHVLVSDPEAVVVVAHGSVPLGASALLDGVVAGVATVVDDPTKLAVLASKTGSGAWVVPGPIRHDPERSTVEALAYKARGSDRHAPVGGLRDAGVLVAEGRVLLRRLLAGSPAWSHGLCEAVWDDELRARLYRSLPDTPLGHALERGPEHLAIVPVGIDEAPAVESRPTRRRVRAL